MTTYTESNFGLIVLNEKLSANNGETTLNLRAMLPAEIDDLKSDCMDWATNGEETPEQTTSMVACLDGILWKYMTDESTGNEVGAPIKKKPTMKINISAKTKIETVINLEEAKASARLLDYDDVLDASMDAEKALESLMIPKKSRVGCTVKIDPEAVPNSYKYSAEGTGATLKRFPSGWFMIDVGREYCRAKSGGGGMRARVTLTDDAKQAIPSVITL